MRVLGGICIALLIIGGLNWGIIGLTTFNIIDYLFGQVYVDRVIYVIVGLAAVYVLFAWKNIFRSAARR